MSKKNHTSKQTSLNFETIKRLIKQKAQEKFSQETIASSSKTQWQNTGKQQK
jgi:histone H3/H4